MAARAWPLAANHDTTRLMTLVNAPTPDQATHRLRHRLADRPPIDVITTHYPDEHGQVLLNLDFPPGAYAALNAGAAALNAGARREGQTLERFLLLAHTTPAHLLSAVGHALTRHPESPAP
ncbi:hypothetical protein [Streptomyces chiangmaiensis]|uniref:Uncharacterized protein n=1 Tax=Streptomyces chiangmaiensis TaxID=766497 RepID=A0ABU7FSW7_9ACTN|nr:hypothetical protein [Streptomyces chiangmaiensis]MED7827192.1 hypothetical protein [Streptomyces chiangmaiensis]